MGWSRLVVQWQLPVAAIFGLADPFRDYSDVGQHPSETSVQPVRGGFLDADVRTRVEQHRVPCLVRTVVADVGDFVFYVVLASSD
jgi:hypothetical protein